jgi:hypothetical protein
MPRDGSNVYHLPPGTLGIPDTTIESNKYNAFVLDAQQEANLPRPIVAGGTGATSADGALVSLGAEKSSQAVTNYDSQVWWPGSFYSAAGATSAPVAGHAFVGWVVSSDALVTPPANLNVVVHARDQNDVVLPGKLYVREKKAGIWGTWNIDGTGLSGSTPPVNPADNTLWWDSVGGELYIYYNDGNSKQWVIASPQADVNHFLLKDGDTMTGPLLMQGKLTLHADPAATLEAATKQYVDAQITAGIGSITVFPPGTHMIFFQNNAPVGWTKRTDWNDFALRVVSGNQAHNGGGYGLSGLAGQNTVGYHAVTVAEMPSHAHSAAIYDPGHSHLLNGAGTVTVGTPIGQCPASSGNPQCGPMSLGVSPAATGVRVWDGANFDATYAAGGNNGHTHSINLNINYLDVIIAYKN